MLPIIKNTELFDFQKKGNYNNWKWGLFKTLQDSYLSFSFKVAGGGALTTWEAKKITISNGEVEVLEIITLDHTEIHAYSGIETTYERVEGQYANTILEAGLYYYYFSDGVNTPMMSEIFCVTTDLSGIFIVDENNNFIVDEADNYIVGV